MKNKLSKILGVGLTLAVLASLLVSAVPAAAQPADLAYGVISTPSALGLVLNPGNIDILTATKDGSTMFAYDIGVGLNKSSNAGTTWAAAGAVGLPVTGVIDIAVSPNYATDSVVVAATTTAVYYSADGGATFAAVAPADLAAKTEALAGGLVTSVAVGPYYADATLSILVGVTGGGGLQSNVLKFRTGTWAFEEVGNIDTAGIGDYNVIDVAFSPNHMSDAEILCVYDDGVNTFLATRFGNLEWEANIAGKALFAVASVATGATMAFGEDYVGTTTSTVLVGTTGAVANDVIRVSGLTLGATAIQISATALAVPGAATGVNSIAVSGPIATSNVLVGLTASAQVYRTANVTGATVWAVNSKAPTGAADATVLWAGGIAFAGTTGIDSALSRSADGGATFSQIGLIDVSAVAGMSLVTSEMVDASTMFIIMNNAAGGGYAARSLFKTVDGGVTWERVLTGTALAMISASPNFATDGALYVASTGSPLLLKSADGGATFLATGVPANVTAVAAVDGSYYFTGALNAVYKTGRWAPATGIAGTVASIVLNGDNILVGTTGGSVYQSANDGISFTIVGTAPGTGTMQVAYDAAGNIYAADSAGDIFRWTGAAWLAIEPAATALSGLAVAADGTLYSSSATAAVGIWRSLNPTGATAAACEFEAMNNATFATLGAATLTNLAVIGNTLYSVDTGTANAGYGYTGRIVAFNDTLTGTPTQTSPADAALLTTPTSATIAWDAVTGATNYDYIMNGAAAVPTAGATSAALGFGAGTTNTWSVRVLSPIKSRYSATRSFTTALAAVAPIGIIDLFPQIGSTDIEIDTTFVWPLVAGATGYEYVIAEDLGRDNKFEIIDYSATTSENVHKLRENLKYNTTYYWRVRATSATTTSAWTTSSFTTVSEPVEEEPPIVIEENPAPPAPEIILEIPPVPAPVQVIPDYLLWVIIGVGAVLIIAVIVLIVRTRRVV